MNENNMRFRTAVFGGFQKQDVLNYLEQSTREYEDKLKALQRKLSEAQRARDGAGETLAAGEERQGKLEEENRRLSTDLGDKETALAEAQAQVTALTAQVTELSAQLQRLAPAAEAYEGLKDRTAGIELEAHARAKEIEADAQARAQKVKSEMVAWMDRLQGAYIRLRSDLNATIGHAGDELKRVDASLTRIAGEFGSQDAALEELRKSVDSLEGPKLPDPLSLEDKDN